MKTPHERKADINSSCYEGCPRCAEEAEKLPTETGPLTDDTIAARDREIEILRGAVETGNRLATALEARVRELEGALQRLVKAIDAHLLPTDKYNIRVELHDADAALESRVRQIGASNKTLSDRVEEARQDGYRQAECLFKERVRELEGALQLASAEYNKMRAKHLGFPPLDNAGRWIFETRRAHQAAPWKCEGCGTEFAEYVNGCPRCSEKGLHFSVCQVAAPASKPDLEGLRENVAKTAYEYAHRDMDRRLFIKWADLSGIDRKEFLGEADAILADLRKRGLVA